MSLCARLDLGLGMTLCAFSFELLAAVALAWRPKRLTVAYHETRKQGSTHGPTIQYCTYRFDGVPAPLSA